MARPPITVYLNYECDEFVCATGMQDGQPMDEYTGMDREQLGAFLRDVKPETVVIIDESGEHRAN